MSECVRVQATRYTSRRVEYFFLNVLLVKRCELISSQIRLQQGNDEGDSGAVIALSSSLHNVSQLLLHASVDRFKLVKRSYCCKKEWSEWMGDRDAATDPLKSGPALGKLLSGAVIQRRKHGADALKQEAEWAKL